MKRYTESHEWIQIEGKVGTVGVTNYAQKELGDIVYVELPQLSATVKAGDQVAVLESTKAAADVYAPMSGRILEVNKELSQQPDLVNNSAEAGGWLFKMELNNLDEQKALKDESTYQSMINI